MPNYKSSGNNGLSKTFFEMFLYEVKKPFLPCVLRFTKTSIYKINLRRDKDKILI